MGKEESPNPRIEWVTGFIVPGTIKLDHMQLPEPILPITFSKCFTFILGSHFLLPQTTNNEKLDARHKITFVFSEHRVSRWIGRVADGCNRIIEVICPLPLSSLQTQRRFDWYAFHKLPVRPSIGSRSITDGNRWHLWSLGSSAVKFVGFQFPCLKKRE